LSWEIVNADCLSAMRGYEDNHFSGIVTDPPYGLSFMGKGWDHSVPGPEFWREALRICKPGSFMIAMGGTRTFHRLTCAIEDAGWEIRDCISYLYGSGFPKSHNHFGIEGFGTALKPAWEPCIVAMKKCDGTFKQNAERWGQAGINIDGCRIGSPHTYSPGLNDNRNLNDDNWDKIGEKQPLKTVKGRWPANVILDEEAGALLDEQSGVLKSGSGDKHSKTQKGTCFNGLSPISGLREYQSDSGGASRFFYCAKASASERNDGLEGFPLKKAAGCYGEFEGDGRGRQTEHQPQKNHHPTVKPLKLMEYLIKLIMPPKDGILLDPFAGSGSTILAAHRLGISAIGIEQSAEYCEIARARVQHSIDTARETPEQMRFA